MRGLPELHPVAHILIIDFLDYLLVQRGLQVRREIRELKLGPMTPSKVMGLVQSEVEPTRVVTYDF